MYIYFFNVCIIFLFIHHSYTIKNDRSAFSFSTLIFYISETLHIVKRACNISDCGKRLAGFRKEVIENATKEKVRDTVNI
jgi:hypothetical protein